MAIDYPEQWEFDFSNPPRFPPPTASKCEQCGEPIHRDTHKDVDVLKEVWNGKTMETRHFCSDGCHHKFYMNKTRKGL